MKGIVGIKHKSQAALEFLMTYGWIITTVLVAIGALAYFGVLNPDKFLPRKCILEAGIGCMDFKVQEDSVTLVLRNGKGEDITISQIAVKDCVGANLGLLKNGEQATYKVGGCINNPNVKFSGDINITYTSDSGISKKKAGSLIDKVETGCGLCACLNTDVNCGTYPACNNCNNLDSYSANYCLSNNVYRDFNDFSCVTQSCSPTTTPELVPPSCTASNGICQSNPAQCVCANTAASCGAFPSCLTCGVGQTCQSGSCVNAVAQFSASYSNLQKDTGSPPPGFDGDHWWYFDTTLRETGGIFGITVNSRQKCYSASDGSNWCDSVKTDIASKFGTNSIPPGGQIVWNNNFVWFNAGFTYTLTETFWGVDANNNNVQASYSFTVVS